MPTPRYTYHPRRKSSPNQELDLLFALRAEHAKASGREKAIDFLSEEEAEKAIRILQKCAKNHPSETLKRILIARDGTKITIRYLKPYNILDGAEWLLEEKGRV